MVSINQDSVLTFFGTNTGYTRFNGTNGIVFPVGSDSNQPTLSNTQVGHVRYNVDKGYLTVFDGTNWVSARGTSEILTKNEVIDILDIWTLILG